MDLTQDRLKEVLDYNAETGIFAWRVRIGRGPKQMIGVNAGACCNGYIAIKIDGKIYYAHRLSWFYIHNEWPDEIDHINHIKSDNRLCNLRYANRESNCRNTKLKKNNKSGVAGVQWNKREQKWKANIGHKGKKVALGTFENKEDAIKARQSANIKYGYHENHGK